jgi:UPF0716 protein FxsA
MIGVPLVELYLLLTLGKLFGLGPTIALIVVTGVLGSAAARFEGLRVWHQWMVALREFRSPAQSVLEGVLVLVGGVLLVTPGVLTDVAGLLLLFPPTRRLVARPLRRSIEARIAQGTIRVVGGSFRRGGSGGTRGADGVVDTTGESVGDEQLPPPP